MGESTFEVFLLEEDALETHPALLPYRLELTQLGAGSLIKRVFFCFILFMCSEFIDTQKQALLIPGALETGKQKSKS